jgi:hypothetical protein
MNNPQHDRRSKSFYELALSILDVLYNSIISCIFLDGTTTNVLTLPRRIVKDLHFEEKCFHLYLLRTTSPKYKTSPKGSSKKDEIRTIRRKLERKNFPSVQIYICSSSNSKFAKEHSFILIFFYSLIQHFLG